MRKLVLVVSAIAFPTLATHANAQAPAQTACQVEAAKSSAVANARLGLQPMPADPRYNRAVDDYSAAPKSLAGLRAWLKANPGHLCAPDAQALLAPREASIKAFAAAPTPGERGAHVKPGLRIDYGDYPRGSAKGGTVAVKMFVEADGRPEECTVTSSSTDSALDAQTCRILMRRTRFEPARDARGLPISSWTEQKIRWPPLEEE